MIDTDASYVSIPSKFASAAGLPLLGSSAHSTAGGIFTLPATHINSLKIGTAELKNLDASINPYLDEVLIGMNVLKHFH
ncbi:retropepsin-like aspartic protease [Methylobacter sp.]|nr:retropepsin-like aspartic protease [Methylobacter sp.]